MNWRWIAPALLGLAFVEALGGVSAYTLGGWDAVRQACLVFVPLLLVGVGVLWLLMSLVMNWAWRGRR